MATDRSTAPAVHPFPHIELTTPAPVTLSHDVKVWVVNSGDDEICRVAFYINGGAFHEQKTMQGTICSMALFNGNAQMSNAQIAEAIDYYGAWRTAQVYDNTTAIVLTSLNKTLEHTLPIVVESFNSPLFPEAELELNKRQMAVNVETARERVKYLATRAMNKLYYGAGHPLAVDPSPEDIENLTRADIAAFHSAHYTPQNCNVVIGGKVGDRELAMLDKALGCWTRTVPAATPWLEPEPRPSEQMLQLVPKDDAVQAAIAMTIRAIPRRHPDYLKLRIAVTALGGYFGSRLMTNIREEKGLTYGIGASLNGRAFDGFVGISTECHPRYIAQVVDEVKKEIDAMHREPLPEQELEMVRRHMLSDLAKTLDSPFNIAGHIGNRFCYGIDDGYFNRQVGEILAVTPQEVQRVARQYLCCDRLRTVIACAPADYPY